MHVLFEDHHLIAVAKPAGVMTQAPAGIPSLEAEVKAYIKEKYAKPAGVYLGIPHRLDRPV
jgi:23S rRNA pseudouridine1911/1915/1917 synthase